MTQIVQDVVYNWPMSNADFTLAVTTGGSCTLMVSYDEGVEFTQVGVLPLTGGELQAALRLRNCYIKVVGIVGTVSVKPDVDPIE